MEKIMNVTGMCCQGCADRAKRALENVPGVAEAITDFEADKITVKMNEEVSDELLTKALTEEDFEVHSIK